MSTDPRVEAVARIIRQADALPGNLTPPLDLYIGDAEQALANADRADRGRGIHRVKVDDEKVERARAAIYKARWVDGIKDPAKMTDQNIARAVLAALTGAES